MDNVSWFSPFHVVLGFVLFGVLEYVFLHSDRPTSSGEMWSLCSCISTNSKTSCRY